jgi:hypothetical protein
MTPDQRASYVDRLVVATMPTMKSIELQLRQLVVVQVLPAAMLRAILTADQQSTRHS